MSNSQLDLGEQDETQFVDAATAPHKLRSLRMNFSAALIGNVGYSASQWLVLVVCAKVLGASKVGEYALALAIASPAMIFALLKLRSVIATDTSGEYSFQEYLTLRLMLTTCAGIVATVSGLAYGLDPERQAVLVAVIAAKFLDNIADTYQGSLQQQERLDYVSRSLLANGVTSLGLFTLGVLLTRSLLVGVLGSVAGSLVGLLIAAFYVTRAHIAHGVQSDVGSMRELLVKGRPSRKRLTKLFWLAAPLGAAAALGSLTTSLPRFFVEHYQGTRELGIFAGLVSLLTAGGLIVNAISQAVTPRLARLFRARDFARFNHLVLRMMLAGAGVGAVGVMASWLFGEQILKLVYTSEFVPYRTTLVLVMCAGALTFTYVFLGTAVTAMRRFTIQLPIIIASLCVLTVACALLIPRSGLIGAGVALIVSSVTQAALYWGVAAQAIRISRASTQGDATTANLPLYTRGV